MLASDRALGGFATGQFDEVQDGRRKRNHGCYTAYMSESAKKTTVDTSLFEQVAAALMIVGKAELAEIMEAVEEAKGGRKAGPQARGLAPTINATRATRDKGA
jgi:hypothetical protein